MKTFNLNSPNPFNRKTYTVESKGTNPCNVTVKSAFLGAWSFNLEMNYSTLCEKLTYLCSGPDVYIQNAFPELTPEVREQFLSDPSRSIFINA
tara:strand:- start:9247 stop:9525 length:279 start_codon:yes stop_codon:yes gene_type:complete